MTQRVALAPGLFVELGEIAMGFDQRGITFQRPLETPDRVVVFTAGAIERPEPLVDFRVRGLDGRGAKQMFERRG